MASIDKETAVKLAEEAARKHGLAYTSIKKAKRVNRNNISWEVTLESSQEPKSVTRICFDDQGGFLDLETVEYGCVDEVREFAPFESIKQFFSKFKK